MSFITHLFQLLSENKVDELIAYIEEKDGFGLDQYAFEHAFEFRVSKGVLLQLLRELGVVVEKFRSARAEAEEFYVAKEMCYESLASYVDALVCLRNWNCQKYMYHAEHEDLLREAIEEANKAVACKRMNKGKAEVICARDAEIKKMAEPKRFLPKTIQAAHVRENWKTNAILRQTDPLSMDRIRKILGS